MNSIGQLRFFILLLALAFPASAAEWIRVRTPGDGDQYFYDRSKLFIQGDEITYWKKVVFKTPQRVKNQLAASGLYRERIHCAEHTLKLISYLLYAPDGNTMEYVAAHENDAAPIIPDTLGDVFEKTTCDLVRQKHHELKQAEETGKPQAVVPAPSQAPSPAAGMKPGNGTPNEEPIPAPLRPDDGPAAPDLK